jgi:glycosyltransferase involved in cell wall biosynthesis|tara:strand:+ start:131 stop:1342 length:1212 start_codon:yes stop_codon:yes gene_type:complete
MTIKVLHIVGGKFTNGAVKGAKILHEALLENNIESKFVNDTPLNTKRIDKNIFFVNYTYLNILFNKICVLTEKVLKTLFLHSPRETFTLSFFGRDITKLEEYKTADIIHIHWLNQGFIKLSSISKIKKPVVWTLRDMWAFTGGSHYTMDFEKYEKSKLSTIIKNFKKKSYKKSFYFIAISDWLKNKALQSDVLREFNVDRIYNNIDLKKFNNINKKQGKDFLNINTDKKIILYGANNPQSKRKGWDIFVESLKKLDKSKYYLLIFGNFWSHKTLDKIGFEYKSLGFIDDTKILNSVYSCADLFVASSIQDGWPKTFAEAMYCKTPVICFSNTSIAEIVNHKINGYVVQNFDSNQLKDGIEWLSRAIDNNNLNVESVKNRIEEFGSDKIAKKYIKLYEKILNEN